MSPQRRISSGLGVIGAILLVAIFFLFIAGDLIFAHATEKTVTFTVTGHGQDIKTDSHGKVSRTYLIYTDHGTYKDTDSVWFWKWNSSDLYGQLRDNQKYTCDTTGFRFAFGSSYRNLVSCHPA